MHFRKIAAAVLVFFATLDLTACSIVPSSGPTRAQIMDTGAEPATAGEVQNKAGIQIVDITADVARRLLADRKTTDFSAVFGDQASFSQHFGAGDALEISVWESPPATLFASGSGDGDSGSAARATVLPVQTIDANGFIDVPFVGQVKASGKSPTELSQYIVQKLKGKANQPQVIIRRVKNATSYVTVVGDVTNSSRMELSAAGERVLDALASVGGVRQPVDKTTIQVTRGGSVETLPLQNIIRDPKQNVRLRAGDVVTALFEPMSFTVLGASGKNDEVNFEAQGISLAQALARSGGLNDSRSDPRGVFIFRFESKGALDWPNQPVQVTPEDKVPVVYRLNLKDPASFFVAQSFPIDNKDLVFVSNAPVAELQKFLNLIFSIAYPVTNAVR